jgi:predicted adenylyl cyclase CyaB
MLILSFPSDVGRQERTCVVRQASDSILGTSDKKAVPGPGVWAAMKEIEVKIIGIDRERVEASLSSLGASKIFEGDVETVFFDLPDKSLTAGKSLLRLRRIGDETTLTLKKFVQNGVAKVSDEYEVNVSKVEPMRLILESLGLLPILRMDKHRVSYALKSGVRVDLDKYTGAFSHIPALIEIEGEDVETIRSHVKLLGFKPEDCNSWSTFDLVDYYSGRK